MIVMSVHLKASCADEASNDPIGRPDVQDDCAVLDDQIRILGDWMAQQIAGGVTVVVAGDYNRKFLETGDRHIASLRTKVPDVRIEPSAESQCWPRDYPQSRSFRTRKLYETFGNPVSLDGTALRWTPYMPSSIGSRDFFLVAGPSADQVGEGKEILLRPEALVHDPTLSLSVEERIAVETQAAHFGVRFDEPSGYITTCDKPEEGELPVPKPFTGSTTVLGFQNVFPSDHCPIVIDFQ